MRQHNILRFYIGVCLILFSTRVFSHSEVDVAGGLISGFLHPIYGLDHLVAMVAVGLWGAQLKNPAIWVLPITFPIVMAVGGLLGLVKVPLPFVEIGISISALALGIVVALSLRPLLWVAAGLVAIFAIFHGHAHGTEVPSAANPLAYGVGFVVSTGMLHLTGIILGLLTRWPIGNKAIRFMGGGIASLGAYFLMNTLGFIS